MININREKLAWAAGILDGEGCISYKRTKHRNVRINVSNTELEMLVRFQDAVGGLGSICGPYIRIHKPQYDYCVNNFEHVQAIVAKIPEPDSFCTVQARAKALQQYLSSVQFRQDNPRVTLVDKVCERGHRKVQGRGKAWCRECTALLRGTLANPRFYWSQ